MDVKDNADSSLPEESTNHYTPGICNIGNEEVSIRKKWFAVSIIAVVVFTYFCFNHPDSLGMKIYLFISFAGFVTTYMQVRNRFCIALGLMGYFNFGKAGNADKVADRKALKKDRQKVFKIFLISLPLAFLFTLLVIFLSRQLH